MKRSGLLALALAGVIGVGVASPDTGEALRKATSKERAQILKSVERSDESGLCRTIGKTLRVSTVNKKFVRYSYNNRVRDRYGCSVGDGFRVLKKVSPTRYRAIADFSWTGAPCYRVPKRVALDLVSDVARRDATFRRCDRF